MLARLFPHHSEVRRSAASLTPTADGLFDEALNVFAQPVLRDRLFANNWASAMVPAADIEETAEALRVSVDLPGYDPKSVQVQLDGDTLTIHAERKQDAEEKSHAYLRSERAYGSCTRSFVLPASLDGVKCEAAYRHGVLIVTLPKREEAKTRTIAVQVQS